MTGLSDKLKVSAVQFLLWQKKCMLFTLEQSDGLTGRPDVFGLTTVSPRGSLWTRRRG